MPARALLVLAITLAAALAWAQPDARRWIPLAKDGLHDPRGPATGQLQEPRHALSILAPDTAGNQVRWVEALERGQIVPRSSIDPGTQVRLRDDDILLNLNGGTPIVRFRTGRTRSGSTAPTATRSSSCRRRARTGWT